MAPDKLSALEQDSAGAVDSLLRELFCSELEQWKVSSQGLCPRFKPRGLLCKQVNPGGALSV